MENEDFMFRYQSESVSATGSDINAESQSPYTGNIRTLEEVPIIKVRENIPGTAGAKSIHSNILQKDDIVGFYSKSDKRVEIRQVVLSNENYDSENGSSKTFFRVRDEIDKKSGTGSIGSLSMSISVSASSEQERRTVIFDRPNYVLNTDLRSLRVVDRERDRIGTLVKFARTVTHLEILGTDQVITNVDLNDLLPSPSWRLRCGQYVMLGEWIGVITAVGRDIHFHLVKSGLKIHLYREEKEASETFISYVSNIPIRTVEDPYWNESTMYPGEMMDLEPEFVKESNKSCVSSFKKRLRRVKRLFRVGGKKIGRYTAFVERVEVLKVNVMWVERIQGGTHPKPESDIRNQLTIDLLEVLAADSHDFVGLNTVRSYKIKPSDEIIDKVEWQSRLSKYLSAEDLCNNEKDDVKTKTKSFPLKIYSKRNHGPEYSVKVLLKFRTADIQWQDGRIDNLEMPSILRMLTLPCKDQQHLEKVYSDVSNEPAEGGLSYTEDETIIGLPSIGVSFEVNDFVVDACRKFPSSETKYGIVQKIKKRDGMMVVDWFEVDENFKTSRLETSTVSAFEVVPMDDVNDPKFRVKWRSRKSFGSEIVCRRGSFNILNFKAGFISGISSDGKVVAVSGSERRFLWPCEIIGMKQACYQDEIGEWQLTPREDSLGKHSTIYLPHYRQRQLMKDESLKNKNLPVSFEEHRILEFNDAAESEIELERFCILDSAPETHAFYANINFLEMESKEHDNIRVKFQSVVSQELEKLRCGLPDGVYVRTYTDRWDLFSILMAGRPRTPYEGGVFIFEAMLPPLFPQERPLVDYISYASKISYFLGDIGMDVRVKPVSLLQDYRNGKKAAGLGRARRSFELSESSDGLNGIDTDSETVSRTTVGTKQFFDDTSLLDVLKTIYDDLIMTKPYTIVNKLHPPNQLGLNPDEISIYNGFLVGRVLEYLANLIQFPHSPWENFMLIQHHSKVLRLIDRVKKYLSPLKCTVSLAHEQNTEEKPGFSLLPINEGVRIFIQNRLICLEDHLKCNSMFLNVERQNDISN